MPVYDSQNFTHCFSIAARSAASFAPGVRVTSVPPDPVLDVGFGVGPLVGRLVVTAGVVGEVAAGDVVDFDAGGVDDVFGEAVADGGDSDEVDAEPDGSPEGDTEGGTELDDGTDADVGAKEVSTPRGGSDVHPTAIARAAVMAAPTPARRHDKRVTQYLPVSPLIVEDRSQIDAVDPQSAGRRNQRQPNLVNMTVGPMRSVDEDA